MVTLLSLTLGMAQAQTAADWTQHGTALITGADVPFGSTIGSPSVVYDTHNNRYLMFFETFMGASATCPAGEWGIGRAVSFDGLSWFVIPNPVVDPDPSSNTYHSCVAAHPGAIYVGPTPSAPGGTVYIYFKGEQASNACTIDPTTEGKWGCQQYTGVGVTRIRFKGGGTPLSTVTSAAPVLPMSTNFGYPKPMRYNDTIAFSYTVYPDVHLATSAPSGGIPQPLGPFVEQGPVLEVADWASSITWLEDEFYNAALACRDTGNFPIELFAGGRDTDFGVVLNGGIGKAITSETSITSWMLATDAQIDVADDDDFRHWDLLRYNASDYVMWYDKKDGSGNNEIHVAYTDGPPWTGASMYSKQCVSPP